MTTILTSTPVSSDPRFSHWDEGGVYLTWPALEDIRDTLMEYVELLTSNTEQSVYDNRTLNRVRLQIQALGGRSE